MHKRRRLTALGLASALAVSLSACAGSSDTKETVFTSGGSETLTEAESSAKSTDKTEQTLPETSQAESSENVQTEEDTFPAQTETAPEEAGHEDKSAMVSNLLGGLCVSVLMGDSSECFTLFDQKYSMGYDTESDYEKETLKIDYEALGTSVMSFEPVDGDKLTGLYAYIENSDGRLQTGQVEKLNFYSKDVDKLDNDKVTEKKESYELNSEVTIMSRGDDFLTLSKCVFYDYVDPEKSYVDQFNGKIRKSALFDVISQEFVDDISNKLLFMDSWDYIEQVGAFATAMLENVDLEDEAAVDRFIEDNKVVMTSGEENTSIIQFELDVNELFKEFSDMELDNIPGIPGSVTVDSETGKFIGFEYDLSGYIEYLIGESADEDEFTDYTVDRFRICGGWIYNDGDDVDLINEFITYADEDAAVYVADLRTHVLSDVIDDMTE